MCSLVYVPARAEESTSATSSENVLWANGSYKLKYLTLTTSLKPTSYKKKSTTYKGKIRWLVYKEKTEPVVDNFILKARPNISDGR